MSSPAQSDEGGGFFAVAMRHSMLSDQLSRELAEEAASSGIDPAQLALARGAMTAAQVEIVETLLRAGDAVPGYEILGVLGCGGMGVVYRARQKNLDRLVALKTVLVSQAAQPTALARFEKEAMTVAQLRHPNIVVAFDFGRHQGRLYLAMELIEGEDLGCLIERSGRLNERAAWGLARQAAAGLAQAAKLGVVHRDIKPGNMLLVPPPEGYPLPAGLPMLKLTDFGLALITSEAEIDERLTLAGSALGTPRYMPPEQFQGSDMDARADIYSLGATVYHMLAGQPPFAEKTLPQILARKLNGQADPLEQLVGGLSPATCQLVADMMAADRNQRVQTYTELFERIDRVLQVDAPGGETRSPAMPTIALRADVGFGSRDESTLLTVAQDLLKPTIEAPLPRVAHGGSGGRWLALASAVVVAAAIAGLAAWAPWQNRNADRPAVLLRPGDWGQYLFDGERMRGWLTVEGGWSPGRDAEGGHALAGKGVIRRSFSRDPPLVNYRLSLAAERQTAAGVELHFALGADAGDQPPRLVLRIAADGVSLGTRGGDRSPFTPLGPVLPFPAEDDDSPAYHEMRVERHATHWLAFFDNQPLGSARVRAAELSQIRLVTEGGTALFAEVQLTELVAEEVTR